MLLTITQHTSGIEVWGSIALHMEHVFALHCIALHMTEHVCTYIICNRTHNCSTRTSAPVRMFEYHDTWIFVGDRIYPLVMSHIFVSSSVVSCITIRKTLAASSVSNVDWFAKRMLVTTIAFFQIVENAHVVDDAGLYRTRKFSFFSNIAD